MTGRLLPTRHGFLRSVAWLTFLGLGGLLFAGCSSPATTLQSKTSSTERVEAGRPVQVVKAMLDDTTKPEQGGKTSWSTTWRVCFKPDRADVTRLEAQAVTTEGSGTSLRELKGNCLELVVARGQGNVEAGMPGRDAQLAEAAALAYRVRAVHDDGTVTPWTEPIPAGSTKP